MKKGFLYFINLAGFPATMEFCRYVLKHNRTHTYKRKIANNNIFSNRKEIVKKTGYIVNSKFVGYRGGNHPNSSSSQNN